MPKGKQMSKKEIILKSDFILSFGSMFACDKDSIKSSIIEAIKKNRNTRWQAKAKL